MQHAFIDKRKRTLIWYSSIYSHVIGLRRRIVRIHPTFSSHSQFSSFPLFQSSASAQVIRSALLSFALATAWLPDTTYATEPINNPTKKSYVISRGPLSDVLVQFAASAGVTLSFDPTPLSGLQSEGLQGHYSTEEGFRKLLQGSGFRFIDTGGKNYYYSVQRLATSGSQSTEAVPTFPPIKVIAAADREKKLVL